MPRFFVRGFSVALMVLWTGVVFSQDYPNKPIRIIVPFPGGAGIDIVARVIGQTLGDALKQSVIIDNRSGGAGGTAGTDIVAKAPPDGYTLLLANSSTLGVAPSLYKNLSYAPLRDFAPITLLTESSSALVVHPALPANSVKELIALAKAKPGQLNFGSAGSGTTTHLGVELFKMMAGVDMLHVPYKGSAPAFADLAGGRVHLMIANIATASPHTKAGRVRMLATTGRTRSDLLPALPTVSEAALPGFELTLWSGIVAPARTPAAVISKLHGEIVKILRSAEMKERFAALGFDTRISNTPAEFAAVIKAEMETWAKVVRVGGVTVD